MELEQRLARLEAAVDRLEAARALTPRSRGWIDERSEESILYTHGTGKVTSPKCPLIDNPELDTCPLCGWTRDRPAERADQGFELEGVS